MEKIQEKVNELIIKNTQLKERYNKQNNVLTKIFKICYILSLSISVPASLFSVFGLISTTIFPIVFYCSSVPFFASLGVFGTNKYLKNKMENQVEKNNKEIKNLSAILQQTQISEYKKNDVKINTIQINKSTNINKQQSKSLEK